MAHSTNSQPDSMPDWYNPFDEPRTIPGGWDVSGFARNGEPPAGKTDRRKLKLLEFFYRFDLNPN